VVFGIPLIRAPLSPCGVYICPRSWPSPFRSLSRLPWLSTEVRWLSSSASATSTKGRKGRRASVEWKFSSISNSLQSNGLCAERISNPHHQVYCSPAVKRSSPRPRRKPHIAMMTIKKKGVRIAACIRRCCRRTFLFRRLGG